MKNKAIIISTGLAMFSMFFGSGNLVFPLLVGQLSEGHYLLAAIGILMTGVVVPFLGVLAMFLFNGDQNAFFGRLGKPATFWFPLFALSLMGPFGVLARCIAVSHGAFKMLMPDCSLSIFSLISCGVIFILTVSKSRVVSLLGSVLTPILLISLALIAYFGLSSVELPQLGTQGGWNSFKEGIFQGYQTMDLLAAFFFSVFVIRHLQEKEGGKESLSIFMKASLVGAGLLSSIYLILVTLGAMYAPQLTGIPPEEMLGQVARLALGDLAAPIVASAVILACLTTAIVLSSLFADFLKKEVCKEKISVPVSLMITLAITFSISTLQFSGIMAFIGPILEITYPALIVLTVISILYKLFGLKIVRTPTAIAVLLKVLAAI